MARTGNIQAREGTMVEPTAPGKSPRRWLWAVWVIWMLVWTILLETPDPARIDREMIAPHTRLPVGKILHVVMYAALTMLSAAVPIPRWRWLLLVFLVLHGMATEYGQTYVPGRTGSWSDVAIDSLGIAL